MSETVPLKTSVKVCRNCQKESTDLLRCSKCREANYCDQECQKKDWQSHKSYCKSKDIQVKP